VIGFECPALNGVMLARCVLGEALARRKSVMLCVITRVRVPAEVLFPSVLRALAVMWIHVRGEERGSLAASSRKWRRYCFVVRPFAFTTNVVAIIRQLAVPRTAIIVASEKVTIDWPFHGTDTYRYGRATLLLLRGDANG